MRNGKYVFEEHSSYFPNSIVSYKTTKKKDALFYALSLAMGEEFNHNTTPETVLSIAKNELGMSDKKEILIAKLLLTYFEKETK